MPFDDLVALTRVLGLVLFFGFFLGMLAWVFRPGSRHRYDAAARMPFAEDGGPDGHRESRHG